MPWSSDQATDFTGFVAQGLSNPGFETGDLSGWTVESGGTWTVDNARESLSGGHTGSWFVRSTGDGVLAQTVDVSSIARQIDLGGAQARARCWLAETATDTDQARIRAAVSYPSGRGRGATAGVEGRALT